MKLFYLKGSFGGGWEHIDWLFDDVVDVVVDDVDDVVDVIVDDVVDVDNIDDDDAHQRLWWQMRRRSLACWTQKRSWLRSGTRTWEK